MEASKRAGQFVEARTNKQISDSLEALLGGIGMVVGVVAFALMALFVLVWLVKRMWALA